MEWNHPHVASSTILEILALEGLRVVHAANAALKNLLGIELINFFL